MTFVRIGGEAVSLDQALGEVSRLRLLEPGDVLVLRFPQRLTHEQVNRIRETVRTVLKDGAVPVLILDGGADISIVNCREMSDGSNRLAVGSVQTSPGG